MPFLIFFLFTTFFCYNTANGGESVIDENVTIFIYHKFGESESPTTNVSIENFDKQLQFLHQNGYQVIPLKQMVNDMRSHTPLPNKTAVITIDDGYTSTYTAAWPILKKYSYPFTVFLYVKAIEKKYRNFLTVEMIGEMKREGVDFQDHGYSHHHFASRPAGMNENEYRQWIRNDLAFGRNLLTGYIGSRPQFLALPYGEYNSIIKQEAIALGYKAVFTQDPGSVSSYIDPFAIPREPILGTDWSTLNHFRTVLTRKDLPLRNPKPSIAPLTDLSPNSFCATLLFADQYQPSSLGIYVSELGWKKGILTKNQLCIANTTALTRKSNRVAISGREKKTSTSAIHYWLLVGE